MKKREYVTILEVFNKEMAMLECDDFLCMDKIHKAIILSRLKLSKLKKYTILYSFDNQDEEVSFLKTTKVLCFQTSSFMKKLGLLKSTALNCPFHQKKNS